MRRGRPSLVSFALGLALVAGVVGFVPVVAGFVVFGLLSTGSGIDVAFTLLLESAAASLFPLSSFEVALAASVAAASSSAFSSASVAALFSLDSSSSAAAFLSRVGVSSSGPSATWKLILVPKRGLSAR